MEAKLIKEKSFYKVIQDNIILVKISANESIDIHYSFGKLSFKNCQAIANGYDLENMADFYGAKAKGSVDFKLGANQGFEDGFQKALSILGDKKFSEEDIEGCWYSAHQAGRFEGKGIAEKDWQTFDTYIKESLQQTEWDVEIKMICPHPEDTYVCGIQYGCDEDGCNYPNKIPLLDANNCLILKRK